MLNTRRLFTRYPPQTQTTNSNHKLKPIKTFQTDDRTLLEPLKCDGYSKYRYLTSQMFAFTNKISSFLDLISLINYKQDRHMYPFSLH